MEGTFSGHYDIMGYSTGDDERPAGSAWNKAIAIIKKTACRVQNCGLTGVDGFDSFAMSDFFSFKRLLNAHLRIITLRCNLPQ